ncbi:MAG: hypothetical protein RLZZ598_1834 [Pseudomonadota bacterium]
MAVQYTIDDAGMLVLPAGLTVKGWLSLSSCTGLKTLPDGLTVEGGLNLHGCTGLTALPAGLIVRGWLNLYGCTGLKALPDDLTVGGWLNLHGCTGLKALPDSLTVGGWLNLYGCTGLPAGLTRPAKDRTMTTATMSPARHAALTLAHALKERRAAVDAARARYNAEVETHNRTLEQFQEACRAVYDQILGRDPDAFEAAQPFCDVANWLDAVPGLEADGAAGRALDVFVGAVGGDEQHDGS